jgi:threonine/homoserine/homoserine lactone efflux protein
MDPALLVWPMALMGGMLAPGPNNLSVASVGIARGLSAAGGLAAGAILGDVILAIGVLGGAAWLTETHLARRALTFGGGVILAGWGVRMIFAPHGPAHAEARLAPTPGLTSGLLLAICNPKALLLHLSAAPLLLISTPPLGAGRVAAAAAVVAVLNLLALSTYVGLAEWARSSWRAAPLRPAFGRMGGLGLGLSGAVLLLNAAGPIPISVGG